jgi:hypothetical protein
MRIGVLSFELDANSFLLAATIGAVARALGSSSVSTNYPLPNRRVTASRNGEKMMIRKTVLITFLVALPLMSVFAQPKTDFSGTWKLNVAKSDFGMLGGPTSRTDVITHKEPSLSDSVTAEGPQGKMQYSTSYTTDGKEAVNQVGEREVKSTLKWVGSDLVFSSKLTYNDMPVTGGATWALSPDGKTLTVTAHYTSAMGDADQKFVFEKQEAAAATPAKATP